MQETFSEVLTAMASDEDILTVAYSVAFLLKFFRYLLFHSGSGRNNINRHQQSINHRISGNEYFLFIYIFLQQILFGLFSRCKVVGTDTVCHLTVHFFRPGRQHIISTHPGLYVSHRNLHIERRKRSSHRSRRIPVHQYSIGTEVFQHFPQSHQHFSGNIIQVLIGSHDIQIIFGSDAKHFQYLIQHLPVLCRDANPRFKMFRIFLERFYKRSHLNRFRTSTENEQYLFHLLYL